MKKLDRGFKLKEKKLLNLNLNLQIYNMGTNMKCFGFCNVISKKNHKKMLKLKIKLCNLISYQLKPKILNIFQFKHTLSIQIVCPRINFRIHKSLEFNL